MNRGQWLKARREELKHANPNNASAYSLRGVAEAIGCTHAALGHLERTDGMPTLDLALKLAKIYGRSPEWVLTGKDASSEHGIPIVGTTLTGPSDVFLKDGVQNAADQQFVDVPNNVARRLYAVRIADSRGAPAFQAGDLIIADSDVRPITGETHLVKLRRDDNFIAIMTLITDMGDSFVFNSLKELNNREVFRYDEIEYLHPIVAMAKAWTVKKI
ncbi:helix-turn-helix domain-containing protein [Erwinia tasmaniensis]|uniref:helix-turn-helix domain-containing protein n=1 Tax=Erwinia tasmaniensis TaxID=338565 RepID=UPI003A4DE2DD